MQILEGKEQGYADWKAKQSDPYGERIFSYAEDWANMLEEGMVRDGVDPADPVAVGAYLAKYAKPVSHVADTDGITGFMYGAAVAVLAESWVHGDQLRRWHNIDTQIGNEGEKANETGGTLNPALLNIGTDE